MGSGAFADVYIGKLIGDAAIKSIYPDLADLSIFSDCAVAVKILPPFASNACRHDFQQVSVLLILEYI